MTDAARSLFFDIGMNVDLSGLAKADNQMDLVKEQVFQIAQEIDVGAQSMAVAGQMIAREAKDGTAGVRGLAGEYTLLGKEARKAALEGAKLEKGAGQETILEPEGRIQAEWKPLAEEKPQVVEAVMEGIGKEEKIGHHLGNISDVNGKSTGLIEGNDRTESNAGIELADMGNEIGEFSRAAEQGLIAVGNRILRFWEELEFEFEPEMPEPVIVGPTALEWKEKNEREELGTAKAEGEKYFEPTEKVVTGNGFEIDGWNKRLAAGILNLVQGGQKDTAFVRDNQELPIVEPIVYNNAEYTMEEPIVCSGTEYAMDKQIGDSLELTRVLRGTEWFEAKEFEKDQRDEKPQRLEVEKSGFWSDAELGEKTTEREEKAAAFGDVQLVIDAKSFAEELADFMGKDVFCYEPYEQPQAVSPERDTVDFGILKYETEYKEQNSAGRQNFADDTQELLHQYRENGYEEWKTQEQTVAAEGWKDRLAGLGTGTGLEVRVPERGFEGIGGINELNERLGGIGEKLGSMGLAVKETPGVQDGGGHQEYINQISNYTSTGETNKASNIFNIDFHIDAGNAVAGDMEELKRWLQMNLPKMTEELFERLLALEQPGVC